MNWKALNKVVILFNVGVFAILSKSPTLKWQMKSQSVVAIILYISDDDT